MSNLSANDYKRERAAALLVEARDLLLHADGCGTSNTTSPAWEPK